MSVKFVMSVELWQVVTKLIHKVKLIQVTYMRG